MSRLYTRLVDRQGQHDLKDSMTATCTYVAAHTDVGRGCVDTDHKCY